MPSSSCSTERGSRGSRLAGLLALLAVAVTAAACTRPRAAPASDEVTTRRRDAMSTYVSMSVAAPESAAVLAAIDAGFAEVERLQLLLSEWREESEISRVNAAAGLRPVVVSEELFTVVESAHRISAASGGAFDVTFAALAGLWDFRSLRPVVPETAAIAERAALVDYRGLVLDAQTRALMLQKPGMRVGLGAIAKGYVVDRASDVLAKHGFPNHLVVAGGDLYARGRKASRRWRIGVRAPNGTGLYATLEVEDEGVATSGNYERYFIKEGVRYHHILDPRTGRPARGLSSVTITAPSAALADAYATAVFVLGREAGLALAQRAGVEALVFDETSFAPAATPKLDARLEPLPAGDGQPEAVP